MPCRLPSTRTSCRPRCRLRRAIPAQSPQTVIDTVALPIELKVNGVDGMLYMQSTSAADGTYTLTVTFKIGMDPDTAQVLVQNRVSNVLAALPSAVQAQGVTVQKKSTAILQIVHARFTERNARRPVSFELRDHQSRQRALALARRRQCQRVRRRANTRCGSGWIRKSCSPTDWCRTTSSRPSSSRARSSRPARPACRRRRKARISSTPSTSSRDWTIRASSTTSSSRRRRRKAAG